MFSCLMFFNVVSCFCYVLSDFSEASSMAHYLSLALWLHPGEEEMRNSQQPSWLNQAIGMVAGLKQMCISVQCG